MSKYKKIIIYLLFLYIIGTSLYLIYKMKQPPEYNQILFDEISNKYSELKDENYKSITETTNNNEVINNIVNPTYLTVNAQGSEYKIIGKIVIDKINVDYPIISKTTDEFLQIAPTKLCGPLINTTGNLCIIGHNYVNNKLFSNLYKLKKDDKIVLIDNNNNSVDYIIYNKYTTSDDDTACLDQNTNGLIEATLITCTNSNNERLIIKCRKVE